MFHAKYLSSSSLGFLKADIYFFFFRLPWVLHGIKFFEQFFKGDHQKNIPVKFG
jgi:hypothetical protein